MSPENRRGKDKVIITNCRGVLDEGVAALLRSDPQAKTLGEYLRAKVVEAPASIVP